MSEGIVAFPPRNEPNAFFADLQALYRDTLRRPQTAPSYVDPEGENVWLTESFRLYLNGCSHETAVSRTISEITTGVTQPTCGVENLSFPPRDLPNAFQAQLEATYRDVLRRPLLVSYVDTEGANVWLAQYLRFRVAGNCDHASAESKVFAEIRGGGVQPNCGRVTQTFNGEITGGDPPCYVGNACQLFTFTFTTPGSIDAVLTWPTRIATRIPFTLTVSRTQ